MRRRYRIRIMLGCLLGILACLCSCAPAFLVIIPMTMHMLTVELPGEFAETIKLLAGKVGKVEKTSFLEMSDDLMKASQELGFDPQLLAYEIQANQWINQQGVEIDLGIDLAILKYESNKGTSMGSCSGKKAAAAFSEQQVQSVDWLLKHWAEYKIRDWSPVAAKMIKPDYSDYTAGCSAAEIGPNQILPSTAVTIIKSSRIAKSQDEKLRSGNMFDPEYAPYYKNEWLALIGYRASHPQKKASLYGWNRDAAYREKLITAAAKYNEIIAGWSGVDIKVELKNRYFVSVPPELADAMDQFITFLVKYEMLPEDVFVAANVGDGGDPDSIPGGDFVMPEKHYVITQGCHPSYGSCSIDIMAGAWAPVISPIDGVVTKLYTDEYGSPTIFIENNRLRVIMLHGKWTVKIGDELKIGDSVGKEGNMGMTFGPNGFCGTGSDCGWHVHLEVFDKVSGQWVNPLDLIGRGKSGR